MICLSTSPNIATLIPVALFIIVALIIAYVVRPRLADCAQAKKSQTTKQDGATKGKQKTRANRTHKQSGFIKEYFLGNRTLSGFVLAMTCIATYGSVSSFVGGPGQAFEVGFGWVYMSCIQVTSLFLLYGIMGKKLALISRKLEAVTIIDVIRARYKSDAVANISAIIIMLFFIAMMVAQFVGGAKIFEAVTGYSYVIGLALFGLAAIIYTSIGGFRGVVLTDTLCGIAMLICIGVLAYGLLNAGGGLANIMEHIKVESPELLDPFSAGNMPFGLYFTQWLLVGIFTFALPQSALRCMGVKNEKSLRHALIVGTIIIGIMMITVTALGVLAHGVLRGSIADYGGSVDNIIPAAIVQSLPPWLCGIAIIGPIAASISTVSSLLIMASSSLVKDVILHQTEERRKRGRIKSAGNSFALNNKRANKNVTTHRANRTKSALRLSERHVALLSQVFTFCIGILVFILAIVPPDVIWKINMFAFGGLESAFCWVLVAGLYWKRANKWGALFSMVGGVGIYCICMAAQIAPFGLHQIVLGISSSFIFMIIGCFIGKKGKADGVFFVE